MCPIISCVGPIDRDGRQGLLACLLRGLYEPAACLPTSGHEREVGCWHETGHGGAVTACPLLGVKRKTSARSEYFAF